MKEIVLTKPPYMNASERRIADMHSVFNILNILIAELGLVESKEAAIVERFSALEHELHGIARLIREGGDVPELMKRIRDSESAVIGFVQDASDNEESRVRKAEFAEILGNFKSVYSILFKRLDELELRMEDPDLWIQIDPDVFRKQVEDVFVAIAKNSKGRYQVHFNLARKASGDYYLDIKVDTTPVGAPLWMPLRMIDILRDLTANARKYTKPGGKVALAVYQDADCIHAVIEDSGCGIPEDELDKVAEFGYRASNVRRQASLGGGYGLTKAAWLVTSWGGSLTIQSELNKGTVIRLSVPNAQRPEDTPVWSI